MIINPTTTIQLGASGPILGSVDANGVGWRINQDGFEGWGEPGTTLAPAQRVRARGAWAGDAFTTGRTLAISGTIIAPTPALLNAAIDSLIAAVSASGFTLTVTESGVAATTVVRRQGETLTPKITNRLAAYSIHVFAVDPRKFGTPQTGTTLLPASSGGLTWPHTWPETWPATIVSGTVNLTNPGNTTGTVLLRLDGPVTGPSIAHSGTAAPITFASSLVLGAGEWLTVNMDTHQVLANDQANRAQYITSAGWSGFDVGANTWAFAAAVFNAASRLTVTATGARR
jgi:hypothetical protein